MQSMDHSIADMYFKGFIDRDEAVMRSSNPGKMDKMLTAENKAKKARLQESLVS
jgi:hypothetical protein